MSSAESRPDIFDRNRRRARRARMMHMLDAGGDAFLASHLSEEVAERFDDIDVPIDRILLIGAHRPELSKRLADKADLIIVESNEELGAAHGAIVTDEDALLHAPQLQGQKFDAVIWPGGLESVNDIPGALIQCRHLLKPGGVLVGGLIGGGSLATLKSVQLEAESERLVARMHPQIDLRAMGDLLLRCGFVLPVVDNHTLNVRYSSLSRLIQDLRESGLTNVLAGSPAPLNKSIYQELRRRFTERADPDGKTQEMFQFILFSGWVPDSARPVPPTERGQNLKSSFPATE